MTDALSIPATRVRIATHMTAKLTPTGAVMPDGKPQWR